MTCRNEQKHMEQRPKAGLNFKLSGSPVMISEQLENKQTATTTKNSFNRYIHATGHAAYIQFKGLHEKLHGSCGQLVAHRQGDLP